MFEVERRGDASIIHVDDDLDIASKDHLSDALARAEQAAAPRVIVSLERCLYCDSSGLAELIRAHKRLGTALIVVVPPASQCRRIFEIAGLVTILRVYPSIDAAFLVNVTSD